MRVRIKISGDRWRVIFLLSEIVFGVVIGRIMPSVELFGYKDDILLWVSPYVGGLGLSFIIAGGGLFLGMAIQYILSKILDKKAILKAKRADWDVSTLSLIIGCTFIASYYFSFILL